MNIVQLLLIGIIVSLMALILNRSKEYSLLLIIAGAALLMATSFEGLSDVLSFIRTLENQAGLSSVYLNIVYKVIAICILCEFSASICNDNHHGTLARAVEFSCKCSVLVLAIPIFKDVLNIISELLK